METAEQICPMNKAVVYSYCCTNINWHIQSNPTVSNTQTGSRKVGEQEFQLLCTENSSYESAPGCPMLLLHGMVRLKVVLGFGPWVAL